MDEGGSAQTAVPPVIGVPPVGGGLLLLLLHPAAASASAATPAASHRARILVRDVPCCARTELIMCVPLFLPGTPTGMAGPTVRAANEGGPAPPGTITLRDRYGLLDHGAAHPSRPL